MGQDMCSFGWPLHSYTGQQVQIILWDPSSIWPLSSHFTERGHKGETPGSQASNCLPCHRQHTNWQGVNKAVPIQYTATKDQLTVYLVKKALNHFEGKPKVFIVTSGQEVLSNSIDVARLYLQLPRRSGHETRSSTVWMLFAEEQQSSTFSHQTLTFLSSQSTVTISSVGRHTLSLVWETRSE